jgi:hypothetical protein
VRIHPRHILSDEEVTVANLWRAYRGGGFGAGPLPFGGGAAEQPALVMDAFAALGAAAVLIEPEK